MIQGTSSYETNSGTLPQQEFTYLEVPTGQGVYTWNDYNTTEFKNYKNLKWLHLSIRQSTLGRPNRVYKKHTRLNSQSIILNPNQWQNATGFKKFSSFFIIKPPSLLIENKNEGGNFELNPFNSHKKMYWG
jgi:hypothetical protein